MSVTEKTIIHPSRKSEDHQLFLNMEKSLKNYAKISKLAPGGWLQSKFSSITHEPHYKSKSRRVRAEQIFVVG